MQNRWVHPPTLHMPGSGHPRRVGWLELFYDLIYVATILQLGTTLSERVTFDGFLAFAGLFTPLWLSWRSFTLYSNRFVVDDLRHRAMVFTQMAGIGMMAVTVPQVLEGEPSGFVAAYGLVLVIHSLFYVRVWRTVDEARELGQLYASVHGVRAALWWASLLVPTPWNYAMWVLAVTIGIGATFSRQARELGGRFPNDFIHLSERYGLLTLIVLGESFMKVLTALYEQGVDSQNGLMAGLGLLVTCGLWWLYFDDIAGSRLKRTRLASVVWTWAHLPLTIGITAVGVSIKKVTFFEPMEPAKAAYGWLFAGSVALVFLTVGALDSVTERRTGETSDQQRSRMRLFSALLAGLLAAVAPQMSALVFVSLIAFLMLVQVFFDLWMAPLADPEAVHHEDPTFFAGAPASAAAPEPTANRKRMAISLDQAVRKGVPNDLRSDLFYLFLDRSWGALFTAMVAAFVLSNAVFAALFLLEPEGVTGLERAQFVEAFAFSVQTMTTIGYGGLSPVSTYAHVLVWVEAFAGLVGTALFTGLALAKAARPNMKALFSRVAVIRQLDGKRTLCFRVGNARGNEIVEASMNVAALVDVVTEEGATFRRLVDLPLVRRFSPMFALTWSVFHVIDEDSPLAPLTDGEIHESLAGIICTMTGHDGTYGQTVHARHVYQSDDILDQHVFVDVISRLPDGRLQVDFTRFHDVRPETA
ncbi:MAG: hypothetical protein EP330_10570 [Deltaproteobacteria bacterium]|nr:MAG: hypothetical protein EP330_10570 [Deltaproteobacteria bacterium]